MADLQECSTRPCSARSPGPEPRVVQKEGSTSLWSLVEAFASYLPREPTVPAQWISTVQAANTQTVFSRYQDVFREERQNSDESCLRSQHMRPPSFPHCNLQFVRNLTRNAIYSQRNVLSPFHPYDPWFYLMRLFPTLRAPRTTL